ncbi:cytidine deaminase [Salinimicrobium catena]|uniref:Cytidine deaminase n=1 Tax=Salinimicrobium catena TaxID=390640 RepID=A0A1H5NJL6_9FLAO|nr:cytidine deaminase [Salinimicrobium catena]SDL48810.1 cytidine deaminase [Salinimicrobium catena]SEF01852.1 cytidine deaminase [Salinimicrobium catena]
MKKVTISADLEIFDSVEELPVEAKGLMQKAIEARENSYSPYSKFRVGAAIQLENGEVVTGSNQENASYPAGLCAERTAIFYAGAKYPGVKMQRMALSARSLNHSVETPTPPCGSCRQAIAEYEVKQELPIEIYFMGEKGKVVKANSISDLLPLIFDNSYL